MLNSSILVSNLETLPVTIQEVQVINAFSNAWINYFSTAEIAGIQVIPGSLSVATTAMASHLSGISIDAPTSIQNGINAFWEAMLLSTMSIWATTPNVVISISLPPTTLIISKLLNSLIASNPSGANIVANIANILHVNGGLGGTATLQPPGTVPPLIVPIV